MIVISGPHEELMKEPSVLIWHSFITSDFWLATLLFGSVALAVTAYCIRSRAPILALAMFMPDQFWLCWRVFGIIALMFAGEFHHGWKFMVAAEASEIVMMFTNAAAIIFCISRSGRSLRLI
jgi:hypothetical protein